MAIKISVEKFDSITNYVKTIGARPNNSVFMNKHSSEKDDSDWTGTKSYSESVEIIEKGYKEGLDKINKDGAERINYRAQSSRSIPKAGVVGYAPIVPNAIIGLPKSMKTKTSIPHKTKVLSIWYDLTACCGVSKENIAKAGRHMLELINKLEMQDFRVELRVITGYCGSDQYCFSAVKVKTDRQPLNPLKIAYPFTHASFLRRQGFKWLETYPEVTDSSLEFGYGTALYYKQGTNRRQWMKDHNVIPANCFYTDFYEAKDNDSTALMKLMELK